MRLSVGEDVCGGGGAGGDSRAADGVLPPVRPLFLRRPDVHRPGIAPAAEARVEGRAQALGREALDSEAAQRDARDPPETECYIEGDREREREPASLPVLLSSLASVAADATALPGPQPAALPTLRELLARVKSETVPTARPPSNGALRARLAGSATTPAFALASSAPPHPSGRVTPRLRATGPPR